VPIDSKSASLNLLEPAGPVQAFTGISLPLTLVRSIQEKRYEANTNEYGVFFQLVPFQESLHGGRPEDVTFSNGSNGGLISPVPVTTITLSDIYFRRCSCAAFISVQINFTTKKELPWNSLYSFTLKDFLRELMNVMRCAILKKILIYIYIYIYIYARTHTHTYTHTQREKIC